MAQKNVGHVPDLPWDDIEKGCLSTHDKERLSQWKALSSQAEEKAARLATCPKTRKEIAKAWRTLFDVSAEESVPISTVLMSFMLFDQYSCSMDKKARYKYIELSPSQVDGLRGDTVRQ